jgi:hypothetical protein
MGGAVTELVESVELGKGDVVRWDDEEEQLHFEDAWGLSLWECSRHDKTT